MAASPDALLQQARAALATLQASLPDPSPQATRAALEAADSLNEAVAGLDKHPATLQALLRDAAPAAAAFAAFQPADPLPAQLPTLAAACWRATAASSAVAALVPVLQRGNIAERLGSTAAYRLACACSVTTGPAITLLSRLAEVAAAAPQPESAAGRAAWRTVAAVLRRLLLDAAGAGGLLEMRVGARARLAAALRSSALRQEVLSDFLGKALDCLDALQRLTGSTPAKLWSPLAELLYSESEGLTPSASPAFRGLLVQAAPEPRFELTELQGHRLFQLLVGRHHSLLRHFLQRRPDFTTSEGAAWLGSWRKASTLVRISLTPSTEAVGSWRRIEGLEALVSEACALLQEMLRLLRGSHGAAAAAATAAATAAVNRFMCTLCDNLLDAYCEAGLAPQLLPTGKLLLVLEAAALGAAAAKALIQQPHTRLGWDTAFEEYIRRPIRLLGEGLVKAFDGWDNETVASGLTSEQVAALKLALASAAEGGIRLAGALLRAGAPRPRREIEALLAMYFSGLLGASNLILEQSKLLPLTSESIAQLPASFPARASRVGLALALSASKLVQLAAAQPGHFLLGARDPLCETLPQMVSLLGAAITFSASVPPFLLLEDACMQRERDGIRAAGLHAAASLASMLGGTTPVGDCFASASNLLWCAVAVSSNPALFEWLGGDRLLADVCRACLAHDVSRLSEPFSYVRTQSFGARVYNLLQRSIQLCHRVGVAVAHHGLLEWLAGLARRYAELSSSGTTARQALPLLEPLRDAIAAVCLAVAAAASPPDSRLLRAWRRALNAFAALSSQQLRERRLWEGTVLGELLLPVREWAAVAEAEYAVTAQRAAPELRARAQAVLAARPCTNLACTNLAGGSEGRLRGRRCGGCGAARYCSEECARADWPQHGLACRGPAAAAALQACQELAAGMLIWCCYSYTIVSVIKMGLSPR